MQATHVRSESHFDTFIDDLAVARNRFIKEIMCGIEPGSCVNCGPQVDEI